MGLIERVLTLMFGSSRNLVKDTAEVFLENAEAGAKREAVLRGDALSQFGAEFISPSKTWFDALIDALNRLPRPMMALGTIGLFVSAMTNPTWFAARMQGIALVPEPLWWLLGAIVSFYFGARHQTKGQEFQRQIFQSVARLPDVAKNVSELKALDAGALVPGRADSESGAAPTPQGTSSQDNPALNDWRGGASAGR